MDKTNNDKLVTVVPNDIAEYDFDTIIAAAKQSKIIFDALNTIMQNALKITTHYDWVLIGGKPYLQESGATKVARMFGISWRILDVTKEMDEGYPSFTYRMEFKMGRSTIECDGARSGKDEFFAGARDKRKSADFVDANDVKKAAYTNCLNNGIKRLVPGLRNIDIEALEKAGIDTKKNQRIYIQGRIAGRQRQSCREQRTCV